MRMRTLWVFALLAAVAIVMTGCSQGAQTQATTPAATPATTGNEAPSDAEAATPPDGPALTAMGTAATSADWTITVKEVEREDSAGGADAASGKELLVIKFELKNGGTKDEGIGPTSFILADETGVEFSATPTGDPKFIFNIEQPIKAGTTREIRIAYEVPKGAGPFTWTFTPFVEGGEATPAVLEVK